jgi:hypothetical protein
MTYEQIVEIEPGIKTIIEGIKPKTEAYFRYRQYESLKAELWPLVGWGARNEDLRNQQAWDIIAQIVIDKLGI